MAEFKKTDWQIKDIKKLATMPRPWSANFSKMGCYKTSTGLWLIERITQNFAHKRVLIITTKTGKGAYFSDTPKALPGWRVFNIDNKVVHEVVDGEDIGWCTHEHFFTQLTTIEEPFIVVTHYHLFMNKSKVLPLLLGKKWQFILVDEAHRLKNRNGQWTKNIKKLKLLSGGYKHIMTGTGFINSPDELWSLLNFCDPKDFSSYWRFRRHFCDEEIDRGYSKVVGIKRSRRAAFRKMREDCSVLRTMQEVHPDIAEPIKRTIPVQLTSVQLRMYKEIVNDLRTLDQQGYAISSPNVVAQLGRLRQICVATPELLEDYYDPKLERRVQKIRLVEPSVKIDVAMDFLDALSWDEEQKDQVVIYSCFVDPLKLLEKRLQVAHIPYLWMQAEHDDSERYKLWHDTWPTKTHQVFMSTISLGSEVINLSSAQYVVFLDKSWSPKDNEQAVSRLWRPGQTGVVEAVDITADNTVDQYIIQTNIRKIGWFNDIFG